MVPKPLLRGSAAHSGTESATLGDSRARFGVLRARGTRASAYLRSRTGSPGQRHSLALSQTSLAASAAARVVLVVQSTPGALTTVRRKAELNCSARASAGTGVRRPWAVFRASARAKHKSAEPAASSVQHHFESVTVLGCTCVWSTSSHRSVPRLSGRRMNGRRRSFSDT